MVRNIFRIIIVALIIVIVVIIWNLLKSNSTPAPVAVDPEPTFFPTSSQVSTQPAEIKASFTNFISTSTTVDISTNFSSGSSNVSIEDFFAAVGGNFEANTKSLLDEYAWRLYRCKQTDVMSTYPPLVLSLQYSLQPNYSGNLYKDQVSGLKTWEGSLFRDTQSIIFPADKAGVIPTQTSRFTQNVKYPYVDLQQAELTLPNGEVGYIRYIKIGDELLIGSDLDCLLRVQEQVFDTGA